MKNNEKNTTMNEDTAFFDEQVPRNDAYFYGSEACDCNCCCDCSCGNSETNPDDWWSGGGSNGGGSGQCDGNSGGCNDETNPDDWWSGNSSGCGSSGGCGSDCCQDNEEEILGIKIRYGGSSSTDKVLKVGQQLNYKATFYPYGVAEVPVFWRSSDYSIVQIEPHPTFHNTVVLTAKRDGVARISLHTAADGVETDFCTITVDSREEVVVEDQDDHFTVTFVEQESTNGKVWKSVGCDIDEEYAGVHIWETDDAYLDTIARNIKYNCNQAYTPQQLALLYRLDPLGVAYYVNRYLELNWRQEDDESYWHFLSRKLNFKDDVYCAIFGEEEKKHDRFYFSLNSDGTFKGRHYTNDINFENRHTVYSVAETVFGGHSFFDGSQFFKGTVKTIIEWAFSCLPIVSEAMSVMNIINAVYFSESISKTAYETGEFFWDIYQQFEENAHLPKEEKTLKRMLGWMRTLLELFKLVSGIPDYLISPPNEKDIDIYTCVTNSTYRVRVRVGVRTTSLEEILAHT